MRIGLILIVLAFPLLELAVLIKLGQSIGVWWTLFLLVFTAIAGGLILREQGVAAVRRAMQAVNEGRPPVEPVVDSMMLMLAGFLLLVPGLITDVAGLLLLVPPIRRACAKWAMGRMVVVGNVRMDTSGQDTETPAGPTDPRHPQRSGGPRGGDGGVVIEGEWERIDDPKTGGRSDRDKRRT